MNSHDEADPSNTPSKRFGAPLAPTRHRTTSQLTTVSVHANSTGSQHRDVESTTPDLPRAGSSTGPDTLRSSRSTTPSLHGMSIGSGPSTPRSKEQRLPDEPGAADVEVNGEMAVVTGDVRQDLKALMSRSESTRPSRSKGKGVSLPMNALGKSPSNTASFSPRRYFVLTNAGKPVFCSHDDPADEYVVRLTGVAQALISIFADDDDRLRSIVSDGTHIAFVLKAPLYLFVISDWGEPEHVLRMHLEYIHLQILSIVSSNQLSRVFQRRSNFDLGRLLEGTENLIKHLIERCQDDFSYFTSTLQPLRLSPALRDEAAAALMPPARFKDLLYVLLVAGSNIITLLRPRKHSIHPSDLHLLLNTLTSSSSFQSSEVWIPICFPKFNPAGFVHAYVSYIVDDIGLVFVSADKEALEDLRVWKQVVLEKLERNKILPRIQQSLVDHPYYVSALACPGLRHFIYKSRPFVQITAPEWEAPYEAGSTARKRLVTMYQRLHDALHSRSGQVMPMKLLYIRTEEEACIAWITKPFEMYLALSPNLPKSAMVAAANHVAKWMTTEEGRIFIKDAPVF